MVRQAKPRWPHQPTHPPYSPTHPPHQLTHSPYHYRTTTVPRAPPPTYRIVPTHSSTVHSHYHRPNAQGGNCDTPTVSCTAATWNTSQCTAETCPASAPGPFKCVGGAATGACQPALWPKNSSCSKCVDLSNCGSCSDTNHGAKGGLYHDQGCNLFTPGGGSPWPQPIPGCTDPDYDISGEGKDDFSARKMCCVCGGGARPHGHKPSRCPPPPGPSTCERVLRFDCEVSDPRAGWDWYRI